MIKSLLKNDFAKKTTSLFSGSLAASLISLLSFFIIAKLYSVDVLGEYYMFVAVVTILNMVSTFGYLQTMPLLKDSELRDMYFSIGFLAFIILIVVSPALVFYIEHWLLLIFNSYLVVVFSLNEQLFIRDQKIKELNTARISRTVINMIFLISSFYIFGDDLLCMIIMNVIAILVTNIFIYIYFIKNYSLFKMVKFDFSVLKEYLKFPRFIGPGMIFHTLAYQVPILVAGNFFSPAIAAYYNMAYKLVYTPASLISGSVNQVFMGKLSISNRNNSNIFNGFIKLAGVLSIVAIVFVTLTVALLPWVVDMVFGQKWIGSVDISIALLPLIFSLIAIAPLTNIFQFTNNQKHIFKVHFFSFVIALVAFGVAVLLSDYIVGVWLFSIMMFVRYIFIALRLNSIRKEHNA